MSDISFPVPAGFTPPEGVKEGQPFDFMASGYFKGKTMYLTSVEGTKVSSESEEPEMESEGEGGEEMGLVEAVEKGASPKQATA